MMPYIVRRLLATIPVMTVVAVVVFMLLRLTTGDPAAIIAGDSATAQDVAAIRNRLGLDRPIAEQFILWIGKVVRGDFGESFFFKKPVAELIVGRLQPTLALATCTLVLAVSMAVPLGVFAAWRRGTWIDRGVMGLSVMGFSVPTFVIGYVLIYLVAIQLGWLPVQGYQRLEEGFGGFVERLILPSFTLSVIYVALIARITRASVLEVLNADHVTSYAICAVPAPSYARATEGPPVGRSRTSSRLSTGSVRGLGSSLHGPPRTRQRRARALVAAATSET